MAEDVYSGLKFTCGNEEVLRMAEDADGTGSDHITENIDDCECSADDSESESRGYEHRRCDGMLTHVILP